MNSNKNLNSVLFLYEGETEKEFYDIVLDKFIEKRKLKFNSSNLGGIFNLNSKVLSKINSYLNNPKSNNMSRIHVFVAYDREGDRNVESKLDIEFISNELKIKSKSSRIHSINEIVATQDLESWFFYDLEGIYKFLSVPKSKRNMKAFPNTEMVNNKTLSKLFHSYNKHYQKGRRTKNFIVSLDINKIVDSSKELKESIIIMKSLYS